MSRFVPFIVVAISLISLAGCGGSRTQANETANVPTNPNAPPFVPSSTPVNAPPLSTGSVVVTSFGAAGDGVADDTRAIDAAIAALHAGQTLSFPCGTYLVSAALAPITVSNVNIAGTPGCTTVKAIGSGYRTMKVGTGARSASTPMLGRSVALSNTLSGHFDVLGGLSGGDYVVLQEGGKDFSTDNGNGHDADCDLSGCRGEVLQIASVGGNTATVATTLHDDYDPGANGASISRLTAPVSGVNVSDLVFDGSGSVDNGLDLEGVVNSSVSNVTAQNFVAWGLLSHWSYNLAWNNVSVQHAGNSNADAFQLWGQGRAHVDGLRITNLNGDAFGFGLTTASDGEFANVTVDAAGTASGRPMKLLAATYNTFDGLAVNNAAGGQNGISLEYYSSHNTFNDCVVTNNGGTGIDGFGNYNSYNRFINCNVSGNRGWQIGVSPSALRKFNDTNWEISGGSYTGTTNASIIQLNGANNYVHDAKISGPADDGIYVNSPGNCINNNSFAENFSLFAIYFGLPDGNLANGNHLGGNVFPNPLPGGSCP